MTPSWKRPTEQSIEQRKMMEYGCVTLTDTTMNGSRATAEQYAYHKDLMMLKYLYDFPLVNWRIPYQDARLAYHKFLARESLRRQDLSIFDEATVDSWWFTARPPLDTQLTPSISVSPPMGTNALNTAASTRPIPLKPAEEDPPF
ncbi:hypothetical protein D6D01_09753 [Aureobasidium pullulans]|uniref:Uncharacterized protein n=1 Tax=Aureobasidium pullulans TaxID=5580 RepID=A0A4S9JXJ4_AURPU|nr:hypothetical protein D6D01_09753 [Aureobasidium pullulans]